VGKSLVMLDTNHIKEYVFGTDKLKEIRGASSLLDRLNRVVMKRLAHEDGIGAEVIYANGGTGLFVVDTDKAEEFGQKIQRAYRKLTAGGASITAVVQKLPDDTPDNIEGLLIHDIANTLSLIRYKLSEAKNCPPDVIALPTHAFMRPCDACGIEYAERQDTTGDQDPDERDKRYCGSCLEKRKEDSEVKRRIKHIVEEGMRPGNEYLWERVISQLPANEYPIPPKIERPRDFNVFGDFPGAKEYLGLIYADANGMGRKIEGLRTLAEVKQFADTVDNAVYKAMTIAIKEHLQIIPRVPYFPFDILLIGGDDIVLVTYASIAPRVALTIAEEFNKLTGQKDKPGHTLSVGVVLAPVKYPFGKLLDLVEDTLKFAKKAGSDDPEAEKKTYGATRINFMIVAGSTSQSFKKVYSSLRRKNVPVSSSVPKATFYATLRPYDVEQFAMLLDAIEEGSGLGRTKLHQLREAVLEMNLTTSVIQGLSVLRSSPLSQRNFILEQVSAFSTFKPAPQTSNALFERVTFPWFASGSDYYTTLLDFVELYDFVAKGKADRDDESGPH
jgi:hypothetical protein